MRDKEDVLKRKPVDASAAEKKPRKPADILPDEPIRDADWEIMLRADLSSIQKEIIESLQKNNNTPLAVEKNGETVLSNAIVSSVNMRFNRSGLPYRLTAVNRYATGGWAAKRIKIFKLAQAEKLP